MSDNRHTKMNNWIILESTVSYAEHYKCSINRTPKQTTTKTSKMNNKAKALKKIGSNCSNSAQ